MKSTLKIAALLLMVISTFVSCKKDKDELTISKSSLSGKWDISAAGSQYSSFEFNESGNYIVTQNVAKKSANGLEIIFGDFKIIDETNVQLVNFGNIKITAISDTQITFELTVTGSTTPVTITAIKAEEMDLSSKTKLFCRTWTVVKWDDETLEPGGIVFYFSAAGTYLVRAEGEGVSTWKWKDASETYICYSWEGDPTCTGDNEVKVDVTSTTLKLEEDGGIFECVPYVVTKSAKVNNTPQTTKYNPNVFLGFDIN